MTTIRLLFLLVGLLCLGLLLGCRSETPTATIRYRISRIESHQPFFPELDRTFTLSYSEANFLTSCIERDAERELQKSTLTYNYKGQLILIDKRPMNESLPYRYQTTFIYDSLGRVKTVQEYGGNADARALTLNANGSYEYDAAGNPVRLIRILAPRSTIIYTNIFQQGNLVESTNTRDTDGYSCTYDNHPNAFRGQLFYDYSLIAPFGASFLISFNRNNKSAVDARKQSLTYDQNNLLVSWAYGSDTATRRPYFSYDYESY